MDYKLVLLDNIWENLSSRDVPYHFMKMLETKKNGYRSRHGDNYLPFTSDDIVATHILICKKIDNKLVPALVAKSVNFSDADSYGLNNPLTSQMDGFYPPEYVDYIDDKICKEFKSGEISSYVGGLTINKDLILDTEEAAMIKDMFMAINFLLHKQNGIKSIYCFGSVEFKMADFLKLWGFEPLRFNGEELERKMRGANYKLSTPLCLSMGDVNFHTKRMVKQYKDLWDSRVDLTKEKEVLKAS